MRALKCVARDTMYAMETVVKKALQKILEFWTVSNRPEIAKNCLEKGPDGFF